MCYNVGKNLNEVYVNMSTGNGVFDPIKLDGSWDIQILEPPELICNSLEEIAGSVTLTDNWLKINVPGSWETQGISPYFEGIGVYKKYFDITDQYYSLLKEGNIYLRFYGVSAWAEVILNGVNIGHHEGIWSPFEFNITDLIKKEENELIVKVIKPGKKFLPLRESLAGFLPDVCMPFGGIWKPVEIVIKKDISIEDIRIKSDIHKNELNLSLYINRDNDEKSLIEIILYDGEDVLLKKAEEIYLNSGTSNVQFKLKIDNPHLWSIDDPYLYRLEIKVYSGSELSDRLVKKVGLREVRYSGSNILINDSPVYIRGILHWGWYPDTVAPIPTEEVIREEISKLKEAGFNLIKHCLYVPIEEYFDIADEMGMLIWEELPLWVPKIDDKIKEKVYKQYNEIVKSIRHHCSIIIWTLGCELDETADYQFLNNLYNMVKGLTDGLIRDNSGSGECYGGLLNENADFYDYHFYTDPPFYKDLLDSFAAQWRKVKPWLFGEFCDSDTIRDIKRLIEVYGELPWWIFPKGFGINWNISYHRQIEKIESNNLSDKLPHLVKSSIDKSLVYRKLVLELARQYKNISGYVITGMRDTPISTSGIFNDFGELKYEPYLIRTINSDTAVTIQWDNRRRWINGGDRLIRWDRFNYQSGSIIRPHIVISHFGKDHIKNARILWTLEDGKDIIDKGEEYIECNLSPGMVNEIATLEINTPEVSEITKLTFRVKIYDTDLEEVIAENFWAFWLYPKISINKYKEFSVCLIDHCNIFQDVKDSIFSKFNLTSDISNCEVIITTTLNQELIGCIGEGKRVLYIQQGGGYIPVERKPFWRESIQIMEKHPIIRGFDNEKFCSQQWYSLATDTVFTSEGLDRLAGNNGKWYPILRRLDARNFNLDEYLVEIVLGKGLIIASTLRFQGGLGDEANGISLNPAGEYLLFQILKSLLKIS